LIKKFINNFFASVYFDSLPFFLKKKIRKYLFSSYFCLTDKKKLPTSNYISTFSYKYQKFILENFNKKDFISKNSFIKLNYLINKINLKKIHLLDFGAGDINTFLEVSRNKNLIYYYFDISQKRKIIKKIINIKKLRNIKVIDKIISKDHKFNFAFFGSSLGYSNNYKKILDFLVSINCKYILFSGIILFTNKNNLQEKIVVKQLNVLPHINYLFIFNKKYFYDFFLRNGYKIVFSKPNQFKKIHFKNISYFSKKIFYSDILFEKK